MHEPPTAIATQSARGFEEERSLPELDAHTIPHKIRHGAVIGASS